MTLKVFFITLLASGTLQFTFGNSNDKWQPNDNFLSIIDDFNCRQTCHPHKCSSRQRYTSIVALAVSYYISSSGKMSNSQLVHEAVTRTKKHLDQPSEVIGEVMQSLLRLLRSIIDKPINDVKQSCPPHVGQEACEDSLRRLQMRNEDKCEGYLRNVKLYDDIVGLFNDKELSQLINEINTTNKMTDGDALGYFSSAATDRYSKLLKRMREQYQKQMQTTYPCNVRNVPAF